MHYYRLVTSVGIKQQIRAPVEAKRAYNIFSWLLQLMTQIQMDHGKIILSRTLTEMLLLMQKSLRRISCFRSHHRMEIGALAVAGFNRSIHSQLMMWHVAMRVSQLGIRQWGIRSECLGQNADAWNATDLCVWGWGFGGEASIICIGVLGHCILSLVFCPEIVVWLSGLMWWDDQPMCNSAPSILPPVFIAWTHGRLGRRNRRAIPCCMQKAIRRPADLTDQHPGAWTHTTKPNSPFQGYPYQSKISSMSQSFRQ